MLLLWPFLLLLWLLLLLLLLLLVVVMLLCCRGLVWVSGTLPDNNDRDSDERRQSQTAASRQAVCSLTSTPRTSPGVLRNYLFWGVACRHVAPCARCVGLLAI